MDSEINSGRQVNIDLAKCISVVCMVIIHTFINYAADLENGFGYVANLVLGGFMAAPVFMCAMGVGIAYTRNQEQEAFFSRGLDLLVIGYVLNALRGGPVAYLYWLAESSYRNVLYFFINGDILHFAGLAMIFIGILKKQHFTDEAILGIGILCSVISGLLPVVQSDNLFVDSVVGLFIMCNASDNIYACFPFMSWFIMAAFGIWFGGKLKRTENLDKFYRSWGIPCTAVWVCGVAYETINRLGMMRDDLGLYSMAPWDAALSLCYCVSCFAFCHYLCKVLSPRVKGWITVMSGSLNLIYIYHWIIGALLGLATLEYVETVPMMLLMSVVVLVISVFAAVKTKAFIRKHKEKFNRPILRSL